MTRCARCGEEIENNFNRKWCVPCRNRVQHELNVRKARKAGYRRQDVRPFWVWFREYLADSAKELREEEMAPLPVMQIVLPSPETRRHEGAL